MDLFEVTDKPGGGSPSDELSAEVVRKVQDCLRRIELVTGQPVPQPKILYDLKGTVAGRAKGGNTIRLNLDLLKDPRYRRDMIDQTVPHELAHIVVQRLWPREQPHGYRWARVMDILGLPATRCHAYDVEPSRKVSRPYAYQCACRTHMLTVTLHSRIKAGNEYICYRCRRPLQPKEA